MFFRQQTPQTLAAAVYRHGRKPGCPAAKNKHARKCTVACGFSGAKWIDSTPLREIRTISPGSTSRTYSASIKSNAQVSEADHPGAIEPSQAQRTESARIANRVNFIAREQQQRIRAFHLIQRIGDRAGQISRLAARDQMHDHFGVAGGLKNRSAMLQLPAQLERVGQIAVVRQREFAFVAINHHRLRVHQRCCRPPSNSACARWPRRPAAAQSRPA